MMAVEIDDCRFVRTDGVAPYSIGIRFGGSVHFIVDEEVVRLCDELSAAIKSRRIQLTRGACPECKREGCHALTCSNVSRELLLSLIESQRRLIKHLKERIESLRQSVTLWQGKHAIVSQENNALRRKLKGMDNERSW